MKATTKQQLREDYAPEPLDLAILKLLPDRGATNGYFRAGRTCKQLLGEIGGEGGLTGTVVGGRMRIMWTEGLVEPLQGTGRGNSSLLWARTPKGAKLVKAKKEEA